MIFIDRSRLSPPEDWSTLAEKATREVVDFFAEREITGGRFDFNSRIFAAPEIKDSLQELFYGKCAFCESTITGVGFWDVEHFRPKSAVITRDGSTLHPGYYWLAYAWKNLYPACPACNRTKGNRFPLADESQRATIPWDYLYRENSSRLLLDPCQDHPQDFLTYDDEGIVASRWLEGERHAEDRDAFELAQTTIDVYGLNRKELVDARARVIEEMRVFFETLTFSMPEVEQKVAFLIEPGQAYLAMRQEILGRWLSVHGLLDSIGRLSLKSDLLSEDKRDQLFEEQKQRNVRRKQGSVENLDYDIFTHSSQISRVEIRNFGPIESLDFDMGPGTTDRSGWKVLLGENAVGKSSILKAIVLTVMGEKYLNELEAQQFVDTSQLLRRGSGAEDEENRCVRVYQATEKEPLTMSLNTDGTVTFNHGGLKAMMLGFGSARWLPAPGSQEPESGRYLRVKNLFNPFVPLDDALTWLLKLRHADDLETFGNAEAVLLRLLDEEGGSLTFDNDLVLLQPSGDPPSDPIPLNQFSDGYQTVLAMAISIMASMMQVRGKGRGWEDMAEAEGLVLIDEIGAHLHPRWKMRIISSLRDAFPRIQFIATTHDPLCLRGLFDNEIIVLHRNEEGEVRKFDNLPSVDTMGIDQLLTSRLFGLLSTLDPDTELGLQEYYELLAMADRNSAQQQRFEELQATVGAGGPLGDSKRDQLIYRLADEYLAQTPKGQKKVVDITDNTRQRIAEIWKQVSENPEDYL